MKNNSAILLVLLSLGLFYTFINPQYAEVRVLYDLAGQYQDSLQNISDIETLRNNLLVDYNSISQGDVERLKKVLPDSIDSVRLALELDSLASNHNIALKRVAASTRSQAVPNEIVIESDSNPYGKMNVEFTFVSTYENFRDFLADMEIGLRIMDVVALDFQTADNGLYEHRITLQTYWLK